MSGIFPSTFTGGSPPTNGIPYAYAPTLTDQPAILYYGSSCVTITQAQMNALLSEFASVFDHAGWVYNPSQESNLWSALVKAFVPGSSFNGSGGGIQLVNGKVGPDVDLTVDDIPGAAPLDSPELIGNPTVPTQQTRDSSRRAASTQFVWNAIADALSTLENIAKADQSVYGVTRFATNQEILDGISGVAVDAAALKDALAQVEGGGTLFSKPPQSITFEVTSVGMTVACSRRIGPWTALYVNGLRQDTASYAINGQSITLLASTANVGDFCVFDFVPY